MSLIFGSLRFVRKISGRVNNHIVVVYMDDQTVNDDSCMIEEHAVDSSCVLNKLPLRPGH